MADTDNIKPPKRSTSEIGVSGTIIYKGMISGEDYNRELTGIAGNKKYEIMRKSDATIRSALQIVKLPLLSAGWEVEFPPDAEGNIEQVDKDKARFIHRELFDRNIQFFEWLKDVVTMFDFGFSVFEVVLEITDFEGQPRIGIAKLGFRKQISIERWETEDGQPGIIQQVNMDRFSIPMEKLLVFSFDKEGDNWAGNSLLRTIYKDWDLKDKLSIVNAMSLEKQGMGVPVVTARENATPNPDDEAAAVDALSNLRANEEGYLKVPSTMSVEMLDMKGQTTKEILPTLTYHDGRIMTGVLARFMELGGASGSGAQSLSKDLSSIFMKSEEAAANGIAAVINKFIKLLCDINFTDNSTGYPKLTFGSIADDDTTELSNAVSSLVSAGAMKATAELDNNLRSRLRVPELTKEQMEEYDVDEEAGTSDDSSTTKPTTKKENVNDVKDNDIEASVKASIAHRDHLRNLLEE